MFHRNLRPALADDRHGYSLTNIVIHVIQTMGAIVRDVTADFTEVGKLLDTGQSWPDVDLVRQPVMTEQEAADLDAGEEAE
jgi:hypothetical protein